MKVKCGLYRYEIMAHNFAQFSGKASSKEIEKMAENRDQILSIYSHVCFTK